MRALRLLPGPDLFEELAEWRAEAERIRARADVAMVERARAWEANALADAYAHREQARRAAR